MEANKIINALQIKLSLMAHSPPSSLYKICSDQDFLLCPENNISMSLHMSFFCRISDPHPG